MIVFNEGQEGRTEAGPVTLGGPGYVTPVVFASFAIGEALAVEGAQARLAVDTVTEDRISANVPADWPGGRADRTVVVGGLFTGAEGVFAVNTPPAACATKLVRAALRGVETDWRGNLLAR